MTVLTYGEKLTPTSTTWTHLLIGTASLGRVAC